MSKYLTPRDGDKNLDHVPSGVVISVLGLIEGHWSDCIVTDNRPEPVTVIPDDKPPTGVAIIDEEDDCYRETWNF